MSEELIIQHCSPTLAGLKTGNIFTCTYESVVEMREDIRRLNRLLVPKGIRILPLRFSGCKGLIYIYRPSKLKQDLEDDRAYELLKKSGYSSDNPCHCVAQLAARLKNHSEFPHEIGLFLGYPPEDVSGFIENKACNSKCIGCWKVYGDEEKARKTFAKYKKCTDVYCEKWAEGKSVERLTVPC